MKRNEKGQFKKGKFKAQAIQSTKFELSKAFYKVERYGIADPSDCDKIKVKVSIYLPTGKDNSIDEKIHFSTRLMIMGESLFSSWGVVDGDYRKRESVFYSDTWRNGFETASKYGDKEIRVLEGKLRNRKNILEEADYLYTIPGY